MASKDRQVNIPLDDFMHDVLEVVTARDRRSTPALLRPVIERYLRRRLKDEGIAAAVDGIRRSREAEARRRGLRSGGAKVTELSVRAQRGRTQPNKNP
jgi:hypothetical protein